MNNTKDLIDAIQAKSKRPLLKDDISAVLSALPEVAEDMLRKNGAFQIRRLIVVKIGYQSPRDGWDMNNGKMVKMDGTIRVASRAHASLRSRLRDLRPF